MAAPQSRAPAYLQPRPKAVATSDLSAQSAGASSQVPLRLTTPTPRFSSRQHAVDPVGEKATSSLIRKSLCPQAADKAIPIADLLPPLTSSNDVDFQLYAIIAIIIKEFVFTWYAKITPDQLFVEEVVKVIAHCTRAVEQRLRKVDLEALIFDELPELLNAHIQAYRTAYHPMYPGPLENNPQVIYHSLIPSPALGPVPDEREPSSALIQKENETAYRQMLVHSALALLLPTEDLENDCLTTLVGQIFSEMIIGNSLGGKACEPWLLWEAINKITELIQTHLPGSKVGQNIDRSSASVGPTTSSESDITPKGGPSRWSRSPRKVVWLILHYAFLMLTSLRFLAMALSRSSTLPFRSLPFSTSSHSTPVKQYRRSPDLKKDGSRTSFEGLGLHEHPVKKPILSMSIWSLTSNLLDLNSHMPWLCATLSMLQWFSLRGPGGVGDTNGIIDRLLNHAISTHVLDAKLIPLVLRSARAALFPGNAPGPPRVAPDFEEQLRIRSRCADSILQLIPQPILDVYFGVGKQGKVEVEEVLDVFSDSYANKHLVYGLVELIIVRLMPELSEKGLTELLEERLSLD